MLVGDYDVLKFSPLSYIDLGLLYMYIDAKFAIWRECDILISITHIRNFYMCR